MSVLTAHVGHPGWRLQGSRLASQSIRQLRHKGECGFFSQVGAGRPHFKQVFFPVGGWVDSACLPPAAAALSRVRMRALAGGMAMVRPSPERDRRLRLGRKALDVGGARMAALCAARFAEPKTTFT